MKGDYVEESTAATVHDLSQRGRIASIRATHEGVGIGLRIARAPYSITTLTKDSMLPFHRDSGSFYSPHAEIAVL